MKLLFVINNLYTRGNGLSGSTRRTIEALKARGHDVRVLSAGRADNGETPDWQLPEGSIPVFEPIIKKQGYNFARADKTTIRTAVAWADVIHLEEPFALQIAVCRAAKRAGKPCVATYHLHPETMFSSVGLEKSLWFTKMTMLVWKLTVLDQCEAIHCPTEQVAQRLQRWGVRARLWVISNGITEENARPLQRRERGDGCVNILSVGRLSKEKRQETLLRAMRYCRNSGRVRLFFAGKGPLEHRLRRQAQRLVRDGVLRELPSFGFYSQQGLRELFAETDLLVHCATTETEGMGCMEAICTGIVPIIAKGPLTATEQFAQSEQSVFCADDPRELAARIDYWIDHPAERRAEAQKYLGLEKNYAFDDTIRSLEEMYRSVL